MRKLIISLFLLGTLNVSNAQIEIMKDFDLGNYSVGFKFEQITDYSRSFGDDFRPIQMFIWYPIDGS